MSDWRETPLGEVVSSLGGLWGKPEPTADHVGVLALRGTDFAAAQRRDLRLVPRRFVPSKTLERRRLDSNCIIIEASGGSKDQPVGRTLLIREGMLERAAGPLSAASFCKILRVDPLIACPRFVHGVLEKTYQSGEIEHFQTQSTGLRNLRTKQLLSDLRFGLPDRPTQRRIAAVLSAFDELIEINGRRIELLEDLARSLYREWFVRFRFPGHAEVDFTDSELGWVPDRWTVRRLGDVASTNKRTLRATDLPDPLRYLDISSVGVGRLSEPVIIEAARAPGRARRSLRDGDVLWATVRPNRRAHALVHDPAPDVVASTGLAAISPETIPASFLFLHVSHPAFTEYLVSRATGSAYPAVRPIDFEEAPIVVPSASILGSFDQAAAPSLRLASGLAKHNRALARGRDLLLPRLVTGRFDLSDIDLGGLLPPDAA